jgi:tetratricopeptide (TPR) repeat protein
MSKIKSPKDKKRTSLLKDRRNVYGECPTSSRKNIRRGKQRSHMELRRAANQELRSVRGVPEEVDAEGAENQAKARIIALSRSAFKKIPDAPLGVVVSRKLKSRAERSGGMGHGLYQRGREAMDSGKLDSAIEFLKQSAELKPHFKTLELLGECYLRSDQHGAAVVPLKASVELGAKPYRSLYLLAQALEALGQRKDAIERLSQAVAIKSDYKAARALLDILRPSVVDC